VSFFGMLGVWTIICYALAIIFNNVGLGALALGLTIYSLKGGVLL